MHVFQVGSPWLDDNPAPLPEGPHFTFRDVPELAICFNDIEPHERRAMSTETMYFAFAVRGPVIFFLYHVPNAFPWSDAPFSAILMNPEDRTNLDAIRRDVEQEMHTGLRVLLVDAASGLIQHIRWLSLPPKFMGPLLDAVQEQIAHPVDPLEYRTAVQAITAATAPGDLAKNAVATARGGEGARSYGRAPRP